MRFRAHEQRKEQEKILFAENQCELAVWPII